MVAWSWSRSWCKDILILYSYLLCSPVWVFKHHQALTWIGCWSHQGYTPEIRHHEKGWWLEDCDWTVPGIWLWYKWCILLWHQSLRKTSLWSRSCPSFCCPVESPSYDSISIGEGCWSAEALKRWTDACSVCTEKREWGGSDHFGRGRETSKRASQWYLDYRIQTMGTLPIWC